MEFGRGRRGLKGLHMGTVICFCSRSPQKPPIMLEAKMFSGSIPQLLGYQTVSGAWTMLFAPRKQSYKLVLPTSCHRPPHCSQWTHLSKLRSKITNELSRESSAVTWLSPPSPQPGGRMGQGITRRERSDQGRWKSFFSFSSGGTEAEQ